MAASFAQDSGVWFFLAMFLRFLFSLLAFSTVIFCYDLALTIANTFHN